MRRTPCPARSVAGQSACANRSSCQSAQMPMMMKMPRGSSASLPPKAGSNKVELEEPKHAQVEAAQDQEQPCHQVGDAHWQGRGIGKSGARSRVFCLGTLNLSPVPTCARQFRQ